MYERSGRCGWSGREGFRTLNIVGGLEAVYLDES